MTGPINDFRIYSDETVSEKAPERRLGPCADELVLPRGIAGAEAKSIRLSFEELERRASDRDIWLAFEENYQDPVGFLPEIPKGEDGRPGPGSWELLNAAEDRRNMQTGFIRIESCPKGASDDAVEQVGVLLMRKNRFDLAPAFAYIPTLGGDNEGSLILKDAIDHPGKIRGTLACAMQELSLDLFPSRVTPFVVPQEPRPPAKKPQRLASWPHAEAV